MSLLAHWQPIAAGAVVALALVYLVWKLGFEGRKPRRTPRSSSRPDVPVSRLVRKPPSRGCH